MDSKLKYEDTFVKAEKKKTNHPPSLLCRTPLAKNTVTFPKRM